MAFSLLLWKHLCSSTCVMTEKCTHIKSAITGIAAGPGEEHLDFLCSLHTEVVFSLETVSNNRKEEQGERHPVTSFHPSSWVVMAMGSETKALDDTDSQRC